MKHNLCLSGGIKFLLRCNFDHKQLKVPKYIFECEIFKNNKSHYIVWNKKDIQIGGCQIYNESWFRTGIYILCTTYVVQRVVGVHTMDLNQSLTYREMNYNYEL